MNRLALAVLVAGSSLSGCTYAVQLDRAQLEPRLLPEPERLDGRVLVVTAARDDAELYSGSPSSFTGVATTLTMPLGEITREAATVAFAEVFRDGVDRSNTLDGLERYRVVVAPRAVAFDYEYNALRNLGLAITPQASVQVQVTLLDAKGRPTWQRTYESGRVSGGTYVFSADPGARIGKATHEALLGVMRRAAQDVKGVLAAPTSPKVPAAAPAT